MNPHQQKTLKAIAELFFVVVLGYFIGKAQETGQYSKELQELEEILKNIQNERHSGK